MLDAATGQNGVVQARVFTEAVAITGIKFDGTAKGGIVIAVQRELGIPVKLIKLIGLEEGPDDLAPFEPEAFADALLGDEAAL